MRRELTLLGFLDGPRWYLPDGRVLRLLTTSQLQDMALVYGNECVTDKCGSEASLFMAALGCSERDNSYSDWGFVDAPLSEDSVEQLLFDEA
jgi:hypothetical protein